MLGPDRFASFETPNVIDPGDDAPIQPPRRGVRPAGQTTGESTAASPSPTSNRAPGLGRTEKIDLGDYQQVRHSPKRLINSIDELDLMETNQQPSSSSDSGEDAHYVPPIDEARNYASALLQDANRRSILVNDEEPTNAPAGLMSPLAYDAASKAMVRNQVWPLVFKVSGVVLVLVFVILVLSRM